VVLAFQSDPPLTAETRIVSLQSGQTAQFFYTVSDISDVGADTQLSVDTTPSLSATFALVLETIFGPRAQSDELRGITLSFGDGQSMEVSDLQGTIEHTYTCTRALCVYNATLQAVTQAGITSTLTLNSRIQVQVSP
jgi:predicted secreted protein